MHILHGSWHPQRKQFMLWGENTNTEPSYRKGRRGKTAPHPYALSQAAWLRYLDQYTTESRPDGEQVTIWLPGAGKRVHPSPEALDAGAEAFAATTDDLTLLGWKLDAVTLRATDALDLLLQIPAQGRGFRLGADLRYWQQAALLAMKLLAEGRYIPALTQQGTQYLAKWEAWPDTSTVEQLTANMPPLCRAIVAATEEAEPPGYLLNHFLSTATDQFIRELAIRTQNDRWLQALTREEDQVVQDNAAKLRQKYSKWEEWRTAAHSAGAFRVCFRLNEPQAKHDDWLLEYLLQATDDPSLLVEAHTVWSANARRLEVLERHFDQPQEKMLTALGLASRAFPPVERSLHEKTPTHVLLSREEAYQFLTDALPLLEANGFAVLVPNWWRRQAKLRARAQLKSDSTPPSGILSRDNLVKYEWQVSIGGQSVSKEEFEQLVALKQPLVQFRGEWIALDQAQIDAALKFFEQAEQDGAALSIPEAIRQVSLADQEDTDAIEIDSPEITGWLDEVFERLKQPDQAPLPETPQGLQATLRPYQARGFGWLAQMLQLGLGACLADDMGLGKTLQTITLWLYAREKLGIIQPALLVCPTSVVGNWRHELGRFAPSLRVYKHQGADRLQDDEFVKRAGEVDVVLTSYALLHRDLETLRRVEWSSVALDEAQNIKNPSTKQAQAARALPAMQKIALTGTPVENRLQELWSIFQFLNPGYLGSQRAFKSNFATPIERYGDEQAAQKLRQLTAPFILRRVKTDPNVIQDLPEKFENKAYCNLTPEQATLYEATVREEMETIDNADDEMARRGNVLRMLTRLKQICNHPAQFLQEGKSAQIDERSGKLARLLEMLDEIREQDERVLIFSQYAQMGELLQGFLRDYLLDDVLFLHGGTPSKQRDEMVRRFQTPQGPPVFILSLKAGGTGLTLTQANHVFHYDRWYNPAVENQATDRAYRIGQTKAVQVHKFISLGTLEEQIDELIEHKRALADSVVGAGENWLTELDTNELHDLVRLRQ